MNKQLIFPLFPLAGLAALIGIVLTEYVTETQNHTDRIKSRPCEIILYVSEGQEFCPDIPIKTINHEGDYWSYVSANPIPSDNTRDVALGGEHSIRQQMFEKRKECRYTPNRPEEYEPGFAR